MANLPFFPHCLNKIAIYFMDFPGDAALSRMASASYETNFKRTGHLFVPSWTELWRWRQLLPCVTSFRQRMVCRQGTRLLRALMLKTYWQVNAKLAVQPFVLKRDVKALNRCNALWVYGITFFLVGWDLSSFVNASTIKKNTRVQCQALLTSMFRAKKRNFIPFLWGVENSIMGRRGSMLNTDSENITWKFHGRQLIPLTSLSIMPAHVLTAFFVSRTYRFWEGPVTDWAGKSLNHFPWTLLTMCQRLLLFFPKKR